MRVSPAGTPSGDASPTPNPQPLPPASAHSAEALMWWDRERPWTVLVPPAMAGLLVTGALWLFDRGPDLENPIASQGASVTALLRFVAGLAAQRIMRWWWVAVPPALTIGMRLWGYFYDRVAPEDEDVRQLL